MCPSGTVGLCDPTVLETIVETVDVTTQNDGAGTLTTTVTTTVTTTDTVTNADSGDLLASGSDYVSLVKKEIWIVIGVVKAQLLCLQVVDAVH